MASSSGWTPMLSSADVQTSGKTLPAAVALRRPATSSSSVSVPASKNLSISCLVGFGDHLDQRFARGCRPPPPSRPGRRPSVNLPLSSVWNVNAFFVTRSTTPRNVVLLADRQLNRDRRCGCSDSRSDCSERSRLARSRSRRLTHDHPRQSQLLGRRPDLFGLHHHAGDGVDDDERGVGDLQRRARVAQEVADAGRVDQVDLVLVPFGVGEAGRQRVLAGDLLFVEIGDRRAVVDLAESVDHAGVGEDGRGELRLARSGVTDERDVSDAGGVVDLHGGVPLSKWKKKYPDHSQRREAPQLGGPFRSLKIGDQRRRPARLHEPDLAAQRRRGRFALRSGPSPPASLVERAGQRSTA